MILGTKILTKSNHRLSHPLQVVLGWYPAIVPEWQNHDDTEDHDNWWWHSWYSVPLRGVQLCYGVSFLGFSDDTRLGGEGPYTQYHSEGLDYLGEFSYWVSLRGVWNCDTEYLYNPTGNVPTVPCHHLRGCTDYISVAETLVGW